MQLDAIGCSIQQDCCGPIENKNQLQPMVVVNYMSPSFILERIAC